MNLQPVAHGRPGQRLTCCRCKASHPVESIVADLDGKAFEAYYCTSCRPDNPPVLTCGDCGTQFPANVYHRCPEDR